MTRSIAHPSGRFEAWPKTRSLSYMEPKVTTVWQPSFFSIPPFLKESFQGRYFEASDRLWVHLHLPLQENSLRFHVRWDWAKHQLLAGMLVCLSIRAIIIIIVVKGLFSASTKIESTLFATNFLYPRANRKALHLIYSMPFVTHPFNLLAYSCTAITAYRRGVRNWHYINFI